MIRTPRPVVITEPSAELVSLEEAKQQLAIPTADTAHDAYLKDLIKLARERVAHDTGITPLLTTLSVTFDCWPSVPWIEVPSRPLVSVSSVTYVDSAGTGQTWGSSNYTVDTARGIIHQAYGVDWPVLRSQPNAVTCTYVAGYSTREECPELLRHAARLAIAESFEDRTGTHLRVADGDYERLIGRLLRTSYP